MNTLGERLIYLRELKKLNRAQVMKNLSIHNLGRYEENERSPSLESIVSLANFYGVSTDWLLTGKGQGPNSNMSENNTTTPYLFHEGIDEILAFLHTSIKEGKISKEDLFELISSLKHEVLHYPDPDAIYEESLNSYERELILKYRQLPDREQGKVDLFVDSLLNNGVTLEHKPEDKKKETESSNWRTGRDETSSGDNTSGRGIA